MSLRRKIVIIISLLSITCFSCGNDDFFDEEIVYQNDSIIYNKDNVNPPNNGIPGDTTSIDTTRTDSTINTPNTNKDYVYIQEITKYMNQSSGGVSVQGADCYGDYLFQFQDKNAAVFIYNLKDKKYVGKVSLTPNNSNHCNNASFSRIFYHEGDEFPLIYVSGSGSGTYNHAQVYRITRNNSSFKIELVQEITFPTSNAENDLYWTDVMMHKDYMCVSTAASEGDGKITLFKIPSTNNTQVSLTSDDIIDSFHVGKFTHHQGANIKNDILYIFDGVPAWGDTNYLRIIDLKNKKDLAKINIIEKGFKIEPEGAFIYNGELYNASNNSGIYKFKLSFNNN